MYRTERLHKTGRAELSSIFRPFRNGGGEKRNLFVEFHLKRYIHTVSVTFKEAKDVILLTLVLNSVLWLILIP